MSAALPPAPNRVGNWSHAYPATDADETTCTACGLAIYRDGTDDELVSIYTHEESGDYFCADDEDD